MIPRFIAAMTCLVLSLSLGFANDGDKSSWIARYMSVSYPLKKITVNSGYGSRKDPFTGKVSTHSGIDLAASYEDVYAMFDGVVESIGSDGRSGNYVVVRHGIYTVSYCHLSRRYVEEGEEVSAGQPIAVSGSTGRSTGAHLHLTVKKAGKITDPRILLRFVESVRNECILALGCTPPVAAAPLMSKEDFLKAYSSLAMEHQRLYGIPSSVTLAQMAFESNWGKSELARFGNNFFGVKCSREWLAQGRPYSIHDDDRKEEKFCNYSSPTESMEHHARTLMGKRYKGCRKHSAVDYHGWLVSLKKAGYATSPEYVKKCEAIITKYKLYLYDQLAQKA